MASNTWDSRERREGRAKDQQRFTGRLGWTNAADFVVLTLTRDAVVVEFRGLRSDKPSFEISRVSVSRVRVSGGPFGGSISFDTLGGANSYRISPNRRRDFLDALRQLGWIPIDDAAR